MPKKPRDYKREVQQRKERNAAKAAAAGDTSPAPGEEKTKKAAPVKKQSPPKPPPVIMPTDCGHIPVPLSQIVPDPNQPRKFFDAAKLLELSKSIVQYDVIEPILIRPIAGGLYMIVFGERRFRGSLMAAEAGHNITHIPAMIKEMTDDEALEYQLAENLHRTDPHPIEDAFTFKKMLEKHTVEEIALRVDKSTKFVAMRMMLADLTPAFQEVFFANKMSLGQAVMLCRVSAEAQAAIFTDEVPDNWKEDEDFMLDDIKRLVNNEEKNLDSAPFKTEDPDLYKEMGACGNCRFNSAKSLLLFVEEQASRVCGNAVCYNIKCVRSYKENIEKVMTDPTIVFVAGSHYMEEAKQKIRDVQALGVAVLDHGTYRKIEVGEKPDWASYLAKFERNFNEGNETREQFEGNIKRLFEQAVGDWEKKSEEVAAARAEGKVRKAFIVAGNEEGKFVEVMATTAQAEMKLGGKPGVEIANALQIEEINKRETRNQELDGEKVWTQVRDIMNEGGFTTFIHDGKLKPIERAALAGAIYESLGLEASEFEEEVLKLEDESGTRVAQAMEDLSEKCFNILCRMLIKEKLFPSLGSHLTSNANYLGLKVAEAYFPEQVKNIKSEQAVKAEQRAQKVKKKIEELQETEVK